MRFYYALIGDVIASRDIDARAAFQRHLGDALEKLSARHAAAVAAPLRLTAGDEVQGLLARPETAVDLVVGLADALRPVGLVWGLGRGGLSTDLGADVATLDGPCFHRARAALEEARRIEGWLRAGGFGRPEDEVLGALFRCMNAIRSRWTDVQARYAREVRGRLQREVAERLEVSEAAVSKSLSASRFAAVQEAEDAARALLRHLGDRDEDGPMEVES